MSVAKRSVLCAVRDEAVSTVASDTRKSRWANPKCPRCCLTNAGALHRCAGDTQTPVPSTFAPSRREVPVGPHGVRATLHHHRRCRLRKCGDLVCPARHPTCLFVKNLPRMHTNPYLHQQAGRGIVWMCLGSWTGGTVASLTKVRTERLNLWT